MYLAHFGLEVNPFSLSPKLEFLFKSGAFEESMAHLVYGVENREAITMITGPIGTGKTMALQSFMANLQQGFKWALVTNTQVTASELLKLVLDDLGVEFPPGCDKSDLLILFKKFIIEAVGRGQRVVVIIDEAQNMKREVLEEVRLLTNLSLGDVQPIQIILVGQPELEAVVSQPELAQLRQRIRVHYRLEPLSRAEVEAYLNHRMAVAGCESRVFRPAAIDRIASLSGGVPRLVNVVAGNALLAAFVAGRARVLAEDVEEPEGVIRPRAAAPAAPLPEPVPLAPEPRVAAPGNRPDAARQDPAARPGRARDGRRIGPRHRRLRRLLVVAVLLLACFAAYLLREEVMDLLDRSGGPEASATEPRGAPAAHEPVAAAATAAAADGDATDLAAAPGGLPVLAEAGAAARDTSAAVGAPAGLAAATDRDEGALPAPAGFFAHVASFRDSSRAERWSDRLSRDGVSIVVRLHEIAGEPWYRVYIGPYRDRAAAYEAVTRLPDFDADHYYHIDVLAAHGAS